MAFFIVVKYLSHKIYNSVKVTLIGKKRSSTKRSAVLSASRGYRAGLLINLAELGR